MITVTREAARRLLLAKQGLWPAAYSLTPPPDAAAATLQAVHALGLVQVDTISVVARNHDLVLFSRVPGYQPEHLTHLLYGPARRVFESLYPLYIQPLEDYRLLRQPGRAMSAWGQRWRAANQELADFVLAEISKRGPLSSRDFENRPIVAGGFNVVKDVSNALEHLWAYDELQIAYRRGGVRYFDLTARVLPDWVDRRPVSPDEAKRYFAVRTLKALGLATAKQWSLRFKTFYPAADLPAKQRQTLLQELCDFTTFTRIGIAGLADNYYVMTKDLPLLEQVGAMHDDEPAPFAVSFIAPLDNLMWERKRILDLFDFEYLWEVYTPAAKRRWGYYVLPILYGSELVGCLDPKAERKGGRLLIHRLTLEPRHRHLADDPTFLAALGDALARFMRFNGANHAHISHADPPSLAEVLKEVISDEW